MGCAVILWVVTGVLDLWYGCREDREGVVGTGRERRLGTGRKGGLGGKREEGKGDLILQRYWYCSEKRGEGAKGEREGRGKRGEE